MCGGICHARLKFTAAERSDMSAKRSDRGREKEEKEKGMGFVECWRTCRSNAVTERVTGLTNGLALQRTRPVQHLHGACWPATLATAPRHAEGHWAELKDQKGRKTRSSPEERKSFEGEQGWRERALKVWPGGCSQRQPSCVGGV